MMKSAEQSLEQQFGQRVRSLRQARGITQLDLAEQVRLTPQGISNIERGTVSPRFWTVSRIAEVLDVAPKDLFDF